MRPRAWCLRPFARASRQEMSAPSTRFWATGCRFMSSWWSRLFSTSRPKNSWRCNFRRRSKWPAPNQRRKLKPWATTGPTVPQARSLRSAQRRRRPGLRRPQSRPTKHRYRQAPTLLLPPTPPQPKPPRWMPSAKPSRRTSSNWPSSWKKCSKCSLSCKKPMPMPPRQRRRLRPRKLPKQHQLPLHPPRPNPPCRRYLPTARPWSSATICTPM